MSDLRNVQRFLATDLTAGGLAAVRDVATKANKDAMQAKTALREVSEEFEGLGLFISPTVPTKWQRSCRDLPSRHAVRMMSTLVTTVGR